MASAAASPPGPAPSVLVTTAPVKQGAIARSVTAYGRIEPAPGAATTLSLRLPGIVQEIEVAPGDAVTKGQVIARIAADPATRASFIQARSDLQTTLARRDQVKDLLHNHLATISQYNQAKQAVVNARTKLDALRREGAGQPIRKVTAPFTGVVTRLQAVQGALLKTSAPLATVVRTTGLIASVGLDPADLARVHVGDTALVTRRPGSKARQGKVIQLGGVANPASGLVEAHISLPAGHYLIGQVISASIVTATLHGVLVPRNTALPQGKQAVLYQVANGHARAVKVKILASAHGQDVVSGAIDPRLPIVTQGNYQLKPGMAVRETATQ